ncbi:transposase subunit B [Bifidobacterium longum subsp. longum]|nr:transposase subunit B [Bifidobacterium longum subsp. longum]
MPPSTGTVGDSYDNALAERMNNTYKRELIWINGPYRTVGELEYATMRFCFASMFVRQVRQCFSAVWADGFPRCRHRFPVM